MVSKNVLLILAIAAFAAIFFGFGFFTGAASIVAAIALFIAWFVVIYFDLFGQGLVLFLGPIIVTGVVIGVGFMGTAAGVSVEAPSAPAFSVPGFDFGDAWMMLTNPDKYAEKQFVSKGERDIAATTKALQFGSVEIVPKTVRPGDRFTVLFNIKNEGDKPARLLEWGVWIDEEARKNGATIVDSLGNVQQVEAKVEGGETISVGMVRGNLTQTIMVGDQRMKAFDVYAPNCGSTKDFKVGALMTYGYKVQGINSIELLAYDYYEELMREEKLEFKEGLSTSSAGPFKLTLRTSRNQPLLIQEPYTTEAGEQVLMPVNFDIFLGLINEQEGTAILNDINITIPDILEIFNKTERACDFFRANGVYKLKEMHPEAYKLGPLGWRERGKEKENITLSAITVTPEEELKYWKCGFAIKREKIPTIKKIQTIYITASVDYVYTITQQGSFKTMIAKSEVTGRTESCEDRKKRLQQELQMIFVKGLPTNRSFALQKIATELCACSTYHNSWDAHECDTIIVNLEGCKGTSETIITPDNVLAEAKKVYPSLKCSTISKEMWFSVKEGGPKFRAEEWNLQPDKKYKIKFHYTVGWLGLDPRTYGELVEIANDSTECYQQDRAACDVAATDNIMCKSLNCKPRINYLSTGLGTWDNVQDAIERQIEDLMAGGKTAEKIQQELTYLKFPVENICQPKECTYDVEVGSRCAVEVKAGEWKAVNCKCKKRPFWCHSPTSKARDSECLDMCEENKLLTKPCVISTGEEKTAGGRAISYSTEGETEAKWGKYEYGERVDASPTQPYCYSAGKAEKCTKNATTGNWICEPCTTVGGVSPEEVCRAAGESCTKSDDCCTGICDPDTNKCVCLSAGTACTVNEVCCSDWCWEGKCKCVELGGGCNLDEICCSGSCNPETKKCCLPTGAYCGSSAECCSGTSKTVHIPQPKCQCT